MSRALFLPLLLLLAGCGQETPVRVERPDLGVAATFPGQAHFRRYEEPTPFGRLEWFGVAHVPGARMDESFHLEVANVPDGAELARTVPQAIETFERWLTSRVGPLEKTELGMAQGPGFRYLTRQVPKGSAPRVLGGVLVVRRGRLHHAQATVSPAGASRLTAFLDSFQVQ